MIHAQRPRSLVTDPRDALSVDRLREVLALHFDPEHGTRFWLERERALGIDVRDRVRTAADLPLLGPFDGAALRSRPLLDFVPRALHAERDRLIVAESGGTTGAPARCVFLPEEFDEAFVRPFWAAGRRLGFPQEGRWLFAGPSGPHVIHVAARAFARAVGELEPIAIDLDPRWARAQTPGSLGARAYLEHVLAQALDVCRREDVRVLFSTPPVLLALADRLCTDDKARVQGVHIGGMPLTREARAALAGAFPNAVLLPAYGNSQAGIAPEIGRVPGSGAAYALPAGRLQLRVVEAPADATPETLIHAPEVASGGRGRVILDRIDASLLLANVVERDVLQLVVPGPALDPGAGFQRRLLVDPAPVAVAQAQGGLY